MSGTAGSFSLVRNTPGESWLFKSGEEVAAEYKKVICPYGAQYWGQYELAAILFGNVFAEYSVTFGNTAIGELNSFSGMLDFDKGARVAATPVPHINMPSQGSVNALEYLKDYKDYSEKEKCLFACEKALRRMHYGEPRVAHRDIKLDNIVLILILEKLR